jgi:apolipoprotein N-acyltransferase
MVISFPFTGSLTLIAFVSWIPILLVEATISQQKYKSRKVFLHAYITFFIYNLGTTFWVWNASPGGSILAFLVNSLLMALVFYGFHLTKKYVGNKEGYAALLIYWIGFEYFHYDWESSWPWLSLGNVFSITPSWIQWYSVTGVLGGSLWVLIVNLLLFRCYQNVLLKAEKWKIQTPLFYTAGFIVIVPFIVSLTMYFNYEEKVNPIEVVAIQPNVNPYEKFNGSALLQLKNMVELAKTKVTSKTDLVVAPETAISSYIYEGNANNSREYQYLAESKFDLNNALLLWGASTFNHFSHKNSVASRLLSTGVFEETYNSSILIDSINAPKVLHKSKLVPGVEKIPFVSTFPFMSSWSIDLGGSTVGYGIEKEPSIFKTSSFNIAPVICYESIFGGFVAEQCNKGAEIICIITNDGWWKNTPGYKQHASFASLRAIENRRSIVRSANTGTTCFINQRGDFVKSTDWWVKDVIRGDINLNDEKSFYTKRGDVIGRSFGFVALLLLLFTFVRRFKKTVSK